MKSGAPMLMTARASTLLIVDVQEKLAPAIHDGQRVIDNCVQLAGLAARLGVPVVVTEHCPDKIGPTIAVLKAVLAGAETVKKSFFCACSEGRLDATAVAQRAQVVVCGTEAHVCLQQTALALRWAGKEVFVVADAAGSRNPRDRDLAFDRMRSHGIEIVSREMAAFEWLERGGTDLFSEINREFLR